MIFGSLVHVLRIRSCPLQNCSLLCWGDVLLPSGGIPQNNNNRNDEKLSDEPARAPGIGVRGRRAPSARAASAVPCGLGARGAGAGAGGIALVAGPSC